MNLFYRIRSLVRELPWKLRRNWQRFRRGWAYSDVWDIDFWFIEMLEPMLRHLKEHHCAHPFDYTDEEWEARLGQMADYLRLMNEENVIEEVYGVDAMNLKEIYETMQENKEKFFEMFSHDFYALWD